ncbi:vanin-like protein 1 isoform X3 [Pieris brassicae]|uniref:vanin-like protein 1 isoform X3 n=1 Tax=Pieris brassicae TaxID=7116 RepID=UPI001E661193|nr:vanin-like protein 1 isoform X3 [Pieris brassicae]
MRLLIIFTGLLHISIQKSTPEDSSYVAAVVEFEVFANTDTNVQNYVQLIKDAAAQNADIIVFPEMTLNRRQSQSISVPIYGLLKEYPIPAINPDLYNDILVTLSSAARENAIYVVINIQEVMNCEDAPGEECPEKKTYYFNTNVVLNREGAVIDRYRKINLFGEYTRTPALKPDLGDFTTDFGVRFGHFICFDLMFQIPAIQTPQKLNITNIIFPTMWFSEMPYLTAVEIQQGYAAQMNVNFLAAGANNVRVGSTGSGIYSGKAGALISLMAGAPTTRLMVARVPKVPGQVTESYPGPIYDDPSTHDNLFLKSDPSLSAHTSQLLVPGYQSFVLSSGETICNFRVNLTQTNDTSLKYRAFIHDGFNIYGDIRHIRVASCSIVSCSSDNPKDCPYRFKKDEKKIQFEELSIDILSHPLDYNTTLKCDDVEYFGFSLRDNKFPLNPANYTFTKHEDEKASFSFKINAAQNNLVTFAIWGRIYDEDKVFPHEITNSDVNNYINIENIIFGLDNVNADL